MIQNKLFRECLSQIPVETRKEFDFIFYVAEKIVTIMKKKSISKKKLAQKLNVTEATVSNWLTGRYDFSLSLIVKISEALGEQIITISVNEPNNKNVNKVEEISESVK